jgi:long-subunit fatty acid transport protein
MLTFIRFQETKRRLAALAIYSLSCFVLLLLAGGMPVRLCRAATVFQQVGIASPPVPVGSGARALGMGGAFIAVADDATAASWNPAGLIQLEKPEISIVGAFSVRDSRYASDRLDVDTSSTDSEPSLNYFSATYPFHWHKNMVLSINYQRLYAFDRTLDYDFQLAAPGLDLDQRIRFDQSGDIGAVGLAGAIELTPRLSIGGTLNIWTDELGWDNGWQTSYRVRTNGTQAGVPVTSDTRIEESYEKFRGINVNLGLFWETVRWGTLGAVVKTPFKASLAHRFEQTGTTTYGAPVNTTTVSTPITTEEEVALYMPLSYGLGWSRRFRDRWTVSLDAYRTEWQDYRLVDSQGNEFSPIDGRFKEASDVDATHHLRLGAEYLFLMPGNATALPLRAGLFYDPEPAEGSPRDFYGLALGAGISRLRFSCDLAYQLRWARDADSGNLIADSRADVLQHTILLSLIYYF